MKTGQIRSENDRTASIIILICMSIVAVGCILGASYLYEYNFYESGDGGKTAKTVAVQLYSLDDCEQAKDYYSCLNEKADQYRLDYYEKSFSPDLTNFIFTITEPDGTVCFDSTEGSSLSFEKVKSSAQYGGTSDFYTINENGEIEPLKINYLIIPENMQSANDKYTNAFQWIQIANSLRYFIFFVLLAAILIIVILLSIVTINAGSRDEESGEIIPGYVDKIPLDVCTLFLLVFFCVAWMVMGLTSAADTGMVLNNVVIMITCVAFVLILMTYLTTLSVRVKMGKLYKNTLIYMVFRKLKRKTPRKLRRALGELSVFKKLIIGITAFVLSEAAVLFAFSYLGILSQNPNPMKIFKLFLIIWAMTRLVIIPIFAMIAINLHYVKEEGERLAKGILGDEIADKLSISAIRAHGRNLDQIRKEINKAMEQELKSEKLRNELITNVSHDIKTPLTSIKSYVDFLQDENLSEDKRREYLAIVAKNTDKLAVLAKNLIEVSQITSGNIDINLEKTSLNIIIEQTVEEFALRFEQSELIPRVILPEDEVFVMGDGEWLWRIFSNLLNNACKYAARSTDVEISVEKSDGKAHIHIVNISGTALSVEGDELLERFVRGDGSRHTEGNGLGLSIAKSLTELQGGTLDISVKGEKFAAIISLNAVE